MMAGRWRYVPSLEKPKNAMGRVFFPRPLMRTSRNGGRGSNNVEAGGGPSLSGSCLFGNSVFDIIQVVRLM